jgi:6-phosphogluconolactonase
MIRATFLSAPTVLFLAALWAPSPARCAEPTASSKSREYLVYVGTYTGPQSKGIHLFRLDASSGKATTPTLAAEVRSPSFLAVHPSLRFLYAVNETSAFSGKEKTGGVSAFAVDRTSGKLTPLNQQPSGGAAPCHLVVDAAGKNVIVANYEGGSVAAYRIRDDGSMGERTAFVQHEGSSVDPRRQGSPHAHGICLDPANRFAFVADLGLDKVLVYRFDSARGTLSAHDPPSAAVKPGSGPRHVALHPGGRFAYSINELASTVTAFACNAERGLLTEIQTVSTLPADFSGASTTAEIEVHPSGKFLYGSNRGHDSIAVFAVEEATGKLQLVEHVPTKGKTPRNFAMDPAGAFLLAANQDSDSIVVFRVDASTGRLTPTGQVLRVGSPVCVKFVPVP